MYFSAKKVAINGYDPVAYFLDRKPVRGTASYRVMWKGVVWHFSSASNQARFEANPRAYAPKYGGYCAYAMSLGYTNSTRPDAWHIHEGRLYFTHSPQIRQLWAQDIPGNITRADSHWPDVLRR